MKIKSSLLAGVTGALVLLAGCNQQLGADLDQNTVCEVNAMDLDTTRSTCETGQKIVYLPGSWGNKQLPVLFAALNCDHRFTVAMTEGAVSCIFKPIENVKESK
ncbi:MAG: hypothetical protein CMI01_15500 [Oceanospirillaceae bacterium]|jgi:hypothetical protein|nr:hypothetical protein [Oceanospirillaceae bacterium]|tara:strand:- start:4246 stop:4557 length:312 start_codon:yes stop_codon:yes gene_type:complete